MVVAAVVWFVVAGRENIRIKRTSHAFVQLESQWSRGRELATGWSDGAGDMAGERQGGTRAVWETQEHDQNLLLRYLGNGFLWCGLGWIVDCGGREKVGKSERGEKGGQSAV